MNRAVTIILKLTGKLAFSFRADNGHWNSLFGYPMHGPQAWPWWHLFSLSLIKLDCCEPTTGRRLWIYTRWGAVYFDFVLDRRGVIEKRFQAWVTSWS